MPRFALQLLIGLCLGVVLTLATMFMTASPYLMFVAMKLGGQDFQCGVQY